MTPLFRSLCLLMIAAACGCTVINTGDALTSEKLLKAANRSSDAVPVDIYWADLPGSSQLGDEGDEGVWRLIEETRLPAELRRRLARNGLRAGVVGGALPDELLGLLDPHEESRGADATPADTQPLESTGVSRATYTLTPGRRVDLQARSTIDEAVVLVPRGGGLSGQTFDQAMPTYVLEMESKAGQSAELRLTPELRHGEQRMRFAPDASGVISRVSMRDAEAYPELAIGVSLAPGETLVVTGTPGAEGRLGGCFHRASDDSPTRRAMLIRVAAAPRDDAFDR